MKYIQVLIIVGLYFLGATSLAIAGEGNEKPRPSSVEGSRGLLDCSGAFSVDCNEGSPWEHSYDSCNGVNNVDEYGIHTMYLTGPEIVYELVLTEQSEVNIHLQPYSNDLDLMLLAGCEEDLCFASSYTLEEEFISRCLAPGTYYFVVDGYQGVCGPYDLTVDCLPCDLPVGGETCEDADYLPGGIDYYLVTDTRGANNDYQMEAGNSCTGYSTDSADIVYRVMIPNGGDFDAEFFEDTYDASVFLVTDCNDLEGSCLYGYDAPYYPGAFHMYYINQTGGDVEAFLIISGSSVGNEGVGTLLYSLDYVDRVCCQDYTCSITTEPVCVEGGGEWLADVVSCDAPNPCIPWEALYDWDFATGDQGFTKVICEEGAVECWEYGTPTGIPDPPENVWGTIIDGYYPSNCGEGILSPSIMVEEGSLLEIEYYMWTALFENHGGNVTVNGELIHPIGGYRNIISENSMFYAYCVEGEWGWSSPFGGGWKSAFFDLSDFSGQEIAFEFDFGSDDVMAMEDGWYISKIRVLAPPTADAPLPEHLSEHLGDLFRLQVFPNPTASYARLVFDLASESPVALEILNVTGRRLRTLSDGIRPAGRHDLIWDLRDEKGHKVAPGVYWARFRAGITDGSTKLIIVE